MLRSFLTLALSMFLLAEASAQTAPAAGSPTKAATVAKATARAAARKAKRERRVAIKSAPTTPVLLNDGWPPLDDQQTAVVATTAAETTYGATGPSSRGEIDNANVHAAPGMPIHIRTSNGMVPYSVRPARKPTAAAQTTLGN